ncbi:hypothetical protein [Paenibacillus xylanexedens]|uniref:hypothetical protein n=1 Tax=Paenibacillus xylanexedens TaxID=528191 RepID=UPI00119D5421|nr:hypothetical protein [Paenibacillus xylanexedens]
MVSNKVNWTEGEALAKDVMFDIANAIVEADLPDGQVNRWKQVMNNRGDSWVTYTKQTRASVAGRYKHTDGVTYPVYKIATNRSVSPVNGKYVETTGTSANIPTGRTAPANLTIKGQQVPVLGMLVVLVNDAAGASGKKAYAVEQSRVPVDGGEPFVDPAWNEFHILVEMGTDWDYILTQNGMKIVVGSYYAADWNSITLGGDAYTFTETYYTATLNYMDPTIVLKSTPDVPEGMYSSDFYVMLRQPAGQYNYFDVYQGEGFVEVVTTGSSKTTYEKACDLATVGPGLTPVVINQKEAEKQFLIWNDPSASGKYVAPDVTWKMDGALAVISPAAHFFYGANSTVPWLQNKRRRADYWVSYSLSISNSRVAIVLEGDPAPDMDGYYRSFGYIGKIIPFADYDHTGNFGITTGMGELKKERSDMTAADINPSTNAKYSGYGRYTSNGMTSISMLRTRSAVMFQSYYPAFITQLPDYSGIGTIPAELSNLVLESDGFQASSWTERYHASPVYLVHQYEGYRGYLDGIVAISDHNLINQDELVVDTEELKDPNDPSKGTWTEVYKFFKINTPVSLFKISANPTKCTVAVLKEVK